MKLTDLKPGVKVFDNTMDRTPPEERVCVVREVMGNQTRMFHVRRNQERIVSTNKLLKLGELVPDLPDVMAEFDLVVGERIRLHLTDGGVATGVATVVRYHEVDAFGESLRQIKEVQLDRSSMTTYPWADIKRLERTPR